MSLPGLRLEAPAPAPALAPSPGEVVAFRGQRPRDALAIILPALRGTASHVVPPLVVLTLFLLIWEIACRRTGAGLPPPSVFFVTPGS